MRASPTDRVPAPRQLRLRDLVAVGAGGLASRRLRATLSALGVAIGIAAIVAVLGISESSKADLLAQLDRLGTNLLTVAPGQTFAGDNATLPKQAVGMIRRIRPVQQTAAIATVSDTAVYRSDRIPPEETGGLSVTAADLRLPEAVGASVAKGSFLNAATARYPATVLGATTATQLGIDRIGSQVWLGGRWFTVVGILDPVTLAPDLDQAALVGFPAAEALLDSDGSPTTIYVRADPADVTQVQGVLAATANPEHPNEVQVSRPSDALAAQAAAKSALNSLLLGLGAVALLVGGVGIANVDGDRRAGAAQRDRPAPRARRHPRPRTHPVPGRVAAAGAAGRRRRGGDRRAGHRRLRAAPALAGGGAADRRCRRGRRGARPWRGRRPVPRGPRRPAVTHRRAPHRVTTTRRRGGLARTACRWAATTGAHGRQRPWAPWSGDGQLRGASGCGG
jgi:putative ABC transport system permease protein